MDWIRSLQKAISMIEDNLLNEIDPDEIAESVYFSSYHFNRIFNMITGVTIGDYIRNRRLSMAGEELFEKKAKVIDAALKYGYETPEGFAKAFTRFHGIAPSLARESKEQLKTFNPISIEIKSIGVDIVDYKIEVKNEFIGSKSKRLGDIDVRYNGTWDETLCSDLMCAIVAAANFNDKSFDTAAVAGASGAAFGAYWTFGTNNCSDFLLMGDKLIVKTFQNLGLFYTHYRKSVTSDWENVARSKIVESIDNGFPAIVRFFDGYGVISGYEDNGKTLYGHKMYFDEKFGHFPRSDYGIIDNVIIINGTNPEISKKELLRNCLEWSIHMATLPEFFNYENNVPCVNGIACYDKIIELLRNEEFFNADEATYSEQKIIRMIYDYSQVKLKDFYSGTGNYKVLLKHVIEEFYWDFIQFNKNKRRFAPGFLRVLAKEFDFCADELEKAAAEYDEVYKLFAEIDINRPQPYRNWTEEQIAHLKSVNYRNMLVDTLSSMKEHERNGISYMEKALQKISSVITPTKHHGSGGVD